MAATHDVHVVVNPRNGGWNVTCRGRTLARQRTQEDACDLGRRFARRHQVDLVIHGLNGRIRSKDSYGNEGPTRDTEH